MSEVVEPTKQAQIHLDRIIWGFINIGIPAIPLIITLVGQIVTQVESSIWQHSHVLTNYVISACFGVLAVSLITMIKLQGEDPLKTIIILALSIAVGTTLVFFMFAHYVGIRPDSIAYIICGLFSLSTIVFSYTTFWYQEKSKNGGV